MGDGSHVYAKPLSDGSYAFALWNLGAAEANVTAAWRCGGRCVLFGGRFD
jgi:hypothetical protein|eukprot:COSAG01_NODE_5952_length_3937_cov_22.825169_3_plen_50_part_00